MANWSSILKWSLRQHDGTRDAPQMDEERRRWLEEALEAMASAPTETQILQTAITVLRAHSCASPAEKDRGGEDARERRREEGEEEGRGGGGEEEEEQLMKAFEETQYLIEDLDHANDLIPMGGVEVIASYLHHPKHSLKRCACELIATATQNNPRCQQAFHPTIPKLLSIINDRDLPSSVNIKALYAISCLTRDFPPGLKHLLSCGGLSAIRHCLASEEKKLIIKALFILMSYYTSADGESKDQLLRELPSLVPELVSLVRSGKDNEVKGHALSTLATLVTHHGAAVRECQREELRVRELLDEASGWLSGEEYQEEVVHIRTIRDSCFP